MSGQRVGNVNSQVPRSSGQVQVLKNPKVKPKKKKFSLAKLFYTGGSLDYPFIIILAALFAFGIVMMYSASYMWALEESGDPSFYLKQQLIAGGLGVVAMLVISCIDYRILKNTKLVYTIFLSVSALMLYTCFFGIEKHGARRWINIIIEFQPSEIMKCALIILFAYLVASNYRKFKNPWFSVAPFIIVLALVCLMMVLQRHISGLVLMLAIGVVMMLVGGVPWKYLLRLAGIVVAVGGIGVGALAAMGKFSYIGDRFKGWLDPFSDMQGDHWQTCQSLIAIGSGGVSGVGFGQSKQKFLYLSESHNDFIFAIICEELGLFGAALVLLLFTAFVLRGFYIASKAPDKFGMMLVCGLTVQIGIQALLNIAVACNAVPNTGISLPFFSYGGTALAMQLAEMGLILSVSRHSETV